jgi:hypothetical protein
MAWGSFSAGLALGLWSQLCQDGLQRAQPRRQRIAIFVNGAGAKANFSSSVRSRRYDDQIGRKDF